MSVNSPEKERKRGREIQGERERKREIQGDIEREREREREQALHKKRTQKALHQGKPIHCRN